MDFLIDIIFVVSGDDVTTDYIQQEQANYGLLQILDRLS